MSNLAHEKKYWNELEGTVFFNKVFSKLVKISKIDVFTINIDREASSVFIAFDLVNELPDTPPEKWQKDGYNRCRCSLNCIDTISININKIGTIMEAEINIKNFSSYYEISIKGDHVLLYLTCDYVYLGGPSVYTSK